MSGETETDSSAQRFEPARVGSPPPITPPGFSADRGLATFAGRSQTQWALAVALVLLTFLAYLPCVRGTFLWDDDVLVLNNPVIAPGGLATAWTPGAYLNYWPITYTVYWLEFQLWELRPLGYHLVNIGLHAAAALLVWCVLRRLDLPGSLLAAAIFALHPVNVESVAWIAQLKGILALIFALVTMLFYLDFEREGGWIRYVAALVAFALSALSKGAALTLPVVLLAIAWWRRGRIDRRDLARVLPLLLVGIAMAWFEVYSQHTIGAELVRNDNFMSRLAVAGCAVWFYLWKFIWPFDLIPIYARWSINGDNLFSYLPAVAILLAVAAAWHWRRRVGRAPLAAIICYGALLLPVLGFVNIEYMKYSLVADHWQYMATIIPSAVLAAAIVTFARRWNCCLAATCGSIVLLLGLTNLSFSQSQLYGDPNFYYTTTLARNPRAWLAENNLGKLLDDRGKPDAAAEHYLKAIKLNPGYADAHENIGATFLNRGQLDEAREHLERALKLDPTVSAGNFNLAAVLAKQAEGDEAISRLDAELKITPDFEAAVGLRAALLRYRGLIRKAIEQIKEQLTQQPSNTDLLLRQAWLLSTNPYRSLRDGPKAVILAEKGWKVTGGNDVRALNVVAAAYAEAGRFSDAIPAAEQALRLATDSASVAQARSNLERYLAGKPLHLLQQ